MGAQWGQFGGAGAVVPPLDEPEWDTKQTTLAENIATMRQVADVYERLEVDDTTGRYTGLAVGLRNIAKQVEWGNFRNAKHAFDAIPPESQSVIPREIVDAIHRGVESDRNVWTVSDHGNLNRVTIKSKTSKPAESPVARMKRVKTETKKPKQERAEKSMQVGPRGGRHYVTPSGRKVYLGSKG